MLTPDPDCGGVKPGTNPVWRLTEGMTERSRRRKFELFMAEMAPTARDRVLDVGVGNSLDRSSNFLEAWYPWPERITAVSVEPVPLLEAAFPQVTYVRADARALPFEDAEFDVGFSNAVIEHVGSRSEQALFAAEITRVCRRVFVTTPNRYFPLDPHTLLPFVHWLPLTPRAFLYRRMGKGYWAVEEHLNPLSRGDLSRCFGGAARIDRQRILGLVSNLVAIVP